MDVKEKQNCQEKSQNGQLSNAFPTSVASVCGFAERKLGRRWEEWRGRAFQSTQRTLRSLDALPASSRTSAVRYSVGLMGGGGSDYGRGLDFDYSRLVSASSNDFETSC